MHKFIDLKAKGYKKRLERNLKLYYVRGIFERRPYLPIITIYATVVSGVSLSQIGIIAAISAVVSLVIEVPSGYLADKFGHKKSLLFGAFLMTISAFSYVLWQNFFGACMGMVIFWTGAAFNSGTLQAFVHETLRELGRNDDFVTVAARERRWAMAGNIVLVALVPLTYHISPVMPFLIGVFVHAIAFVLYTFMVTPKAVHQEIQEDITDGFFALIATIKERKEIILFFFLGAVTAAGNKLPQFREIYFQEIGVPLWFFGFVLSITGVVTIFFTYGVPYVKKIKPRVFYGIDFLWVAFFSILLGLISHPVFGIIAFVIFGGYRRVRSIVIHSHLLDGCPTKELKATYLSVYEFFSSFAGIFIPLVLGYLIGHFGVQRGYVAFGAIFLIAFSPLYIIVYRQLHKE